MELGCRKRLSLNEFLDERNMSVVDVSICNYVHQLAYVHVTYLSDHVYQNSILNNVPVVGCKNVL